MRLSPTRCTRVSNSQSGPRSACDLVIYCMCRTYLTGEDTNVFVEGIEWANVAGRQSSSSSASCAAAAAAAAGDRRPGWRGRARCHCRQLTFLEYKSQQWKHWMPVHTHTHTFVHATQTCVKTIILSDNFLWKKIKFFPEQNKSRKRVTTVFLVIGPEICFDNSTKWHKSYNVPVWVSHFARIIFCAHKHV